MPQSVKSRSVLSGVEYRSGSQSKLTLSGYTSPYFQPSLARTGHYAHTPGTLCTDFNQARDITSLLNQILCSRTSYRRTSQEYSIMLLLLILSLARMLEMNRRAP
jgi:hypothetical protein